MGRGAWIAGIVMALALAACGNRESSPEGEVQEATLPAQAAEDLATPLGSIQHQVALLKAGDLDAFRACFTPRLRASVTAEAMAKGAREIGSMTIADLFAGVEEGEHDGHKTAKVKMKNGRTLTTLILTDGRWLADTIWFR